jgi:threonine/homoserine/homoserine lactone efflux protein
LIETPRLLGYLVYTFILVITPGATTTVVVRRTLAGGRYAGWSTALGAAAGNAAHAMAAGLGLAVLIARWPIGLAVLRTGGAAYLAWLGAIGVYRALRDPDGGLRIEQGVGDSDARAGSFRQGLTVTLLNPATLTFYLVAVPSFIPGGAGAAAFMTLAAIHVTMAFGCHLLWVVAMHTLRTFFRRAIARRLFEGATGLALLALAVRIMSGAAAMPADAR